MRPSKEQIAAYADGELAGEARRDVEAALAADPALKAEVDAHRALKAKLSAQFGPIADAPVPDQLISAVKRGPSIVEFAAASRQRQRRARPPATWWGPALAASLVLGLVGFGTSQKVEPDYAAGDVATALDRQLVATQPADAPVRILLSFRDAKGQFCRGFSNAAQSGIACRDEQGWRLRKVVGGAAQERGDFRQAGSADAEIMTAIQDLAQGPALDARGEQDARLAGWRSEG
ncbi:anti-sigma factor [Novosphingobium sp. 9U]|uniref:anti-sigma factor n=1 Tax=Novosphingobium sp. 9U TaxID=2653158 RepID=UPI0012F28D56|nr:anti-sigma factor [Novosphingobium sp. 9U]VWX48743.1 conserved hypothetical protein [Novosphingobium sp. 9U]